MDFLLLLGGVLIFLLVLLQVYAKLHKFKWSVRDKKDFQKRWEQVKEIKDGKMSIIEADKLLEHYLHKRGWNGSLGQILKEKEAYFKNINGIWWAHKMRNNLAHQLDYKVDHSQIKRAINEFSKAFRDLGLY